MPEQREILIIESDQPTAELYQRELGRDYQVMLCADRHTALEVLRTHSISAIILEPVLQDEQGWQLLAALKHQGGPSSIPVIVCSTRDERCRGLQLGADAYLVKPTLPATLHEMLQQMLKLD